MTSAELVSLQFGTVIEDAADFYSARLSRAERKVRVVVLRQNNSHLVFCSLTRICCALLRSRDRSQRSSFTTMASQHSASARLLRSRIQQQREARGGAGPPRAKLPSGMQSAGAARDALALASDTAVAETWVQ